MNRLMPLLALRWSHHSPIAQRRTEGGTQVRREQAPSLEGSQKIVFRDLRIPSFFMRKSNVEG